jgi:uncharacterized protein (DUF885 family)
MKIYTAIIISLALGITARRACAYEQVLSDEQIQGTIEASKLQESFDRYLANLEITDPEEATRDGDHGSDANLTQRDPEHENARLTALENYLGDVRAIDADKLTPANKIDHTLFETKLLMDIFNIQHLQPLRKQPQYYLSSLDSIYGVLNKDFEPYELRSRNALSRLEQLPGVLQQAEQNLYHPPRLWVEETIAECDDADKSFSTLAPMFKRLVGIDPVLQAEVDKAIQGARAAVKRYRTYLQEDAMVQADGDFRIGDEAYGYYLERWHHLSITPPQARRLAKRAYDKTRADFMTELAQYLGRRDVKPDDYEDAVYKMSQERAMPEDLTGAFQQEIERSFEHFDRLRIFPVPQERLRTLETPSYIARRVPFVYYDPPYPLDMVRMADLYINVPSKRLAPNVQQQVLRAAFNYPYIEMTVAQEVYPGRHLQDAMTAELSRQRKTADQPCLTNGWAAYAQQVAMEQGFFTSHHAKLIYLRWELVRDARAYIDASLHMKEMTQEEAMNFLVQDAGMSDIQAREEILRVSINPTEGVSYLIGRDEINRLRDKYSDILERKFDLRDFHTRLLSIGKAPVSMLDDELKRSYEINKPATELK